MMTSDLLIAFLASTAGAATPLVVASMGELVTERSGVLNLGLEGMMLVGAVVGFGVTLTSGSMTIGLLAAMAAGMLMAMVFGFLVLTLQTNQVATGLALTLFGIGVSAFIGRSYVGQTVERMPILWGFDGMEYFSIVLVLLVGWMLAHTRLGLIIRAVGESPHSAHAIGFPVIGLRYGTVLFGGAMAGLGGAYLSLALTPMWVEGMTAGRGWIALAQVVFATWKPRGVLVGAYLFGGVTVLQFHGQGMGLAIPSEFLSMLPYIATIVVLVLICRNPQTILLNKPMSLGQNFKPD
ncbi:simple sugar transport system permease protein [Duganella sp. CF402]|uniref:ABC transporter permease n=1 Tax=unclassified Duganella TaxID=2636909 RepID=UPI0008C23A09|nr:MULTISPECIES: ABC transporter permease [unclassified Duganella]RZT05784.1 nucleoside ABC transporter membrane protein [Duganella sp. BK701]SEM91316.1 simple sugar transport system permease protein [Duganella sp. CF402]